MNLLRMGLCGAHRSGKTTIAKAIAKAHNMPFIETQSSRIYQDAGLSPRDHIPMNVRLDIQTRILEQSCKQWSEVEGGFITDRTPIDMAAYTLAELNGANAAWLEDNPDYLDVFQAYIGACFCTTLEYFDAWVLVPHLKTEVHPGSLKAAICQPYQEKLEEVMLDLMRKWLYEQGHTDAAMIPAHVTDVEGRNNLAISIYSRMNRDKFREAEETLKRERVARGILH